ncbi:META domain-containing protein [Synechococcus elongatus]|uniref:META domain-containing protein n=1 Tax=Synechococcus elongatus TaxID=32046 RepID=UPI00003A014D|nr:META domain-containing protein [Synechococcus elongatus]WKW04381.1 META domain-containing protein [Synechococcus elongatus PCC 7942 = FACHB-805]
MSALVFGATAIAQPLRLSAAPEPSKLEDITWELISFRQVNGEQLAAVAPEQKASLRLQSGQTTPQLQGNTGCNSFFGSYRLESNTNQLQIKPVGSTLRACLSTALSQQEQALLTGLAQVTTYRLEGERLQLQNSAQQVLFTLRPQPMIALTQTQWQLQRYNNGEGALIPPIADTDVTAQFAADSQRLSGFTGCNRYFATYKVQQQQLTVGAIGSTRMACGRDQATQEQAFLQLLAASHSYQLEGDRLELYDAQQQLLAVFGAKAGS